MRLPDRLRPADPAALRRALRNWSLCLPAALAAGWAGERLGVPLPWVLGPLVAAAALSVAGLRLSSPTAVRQGGLLVIGAALGLHIPAGAAGALALWLPVMLAAALLATVLTSWLSVFFARLARVDDTTAYFALMPGGLSEMAIVGAGVGARAEPVALSQALRLALVVCVLPPIIVAMGIHGDFLQLDAARALPLPTLALLLVAALGGVWVMARLGTANPWLLGALVVAATLSTTGLIEGQMPPLLFNAGQFVLGLAIGVRFRRDVLGKLPRVAAWASAFTLGITALLFAAGAALSALTGLDLASAALATSGGGVAEMALTAKLLQLDMTLVLGFHVVRAFVVNGLCLQIFRLLTRVGLFRAAARLADRTVGPPR